MIRLYQHTLSGGTVYWEKTEGPANQEVRILDEEFCHAFMMIDWMRFGKKICQIMSPWQLLETKMAHLDPVSDPVVAEGNGLRTPLFALLKCKFATDGVVIRNNSGLLRKTQIF